MDTNKLLKKIISELDLNSVVLITLDRSDNLQMVAASRCDSESLLASQILSRLSTALWREEIKDPVNKLPC